ncbi:Pyridoxamine 5'-phosphate oxidase, Alr4036 family, FMN-binding domain containing protein, partial [Parasponia andersonii]
QLLLDALEANSRLKHSSFFHLATVGCNGRPSNRTVVLSGFRDDSDKIQINTDYRSRKIEELKHCPFARICWYFTDSWEQFRITGKIDIIDGTNADPLKLQVRETNTLLRLGCVLCFSSHLVIQRFVLLGCWDLLKQPLNPNNGLVQIFSL